MFLCSRELLQRGSQLDGKEEGRGRICVSEVGVLAILVESRLLLGALLMQPF